MRIIHTESRGDEVTRIELFAGIHKFIITEHSGEMIIRADSKYLIVKSLADFKIAVSAQAEKL